MDRDKEENILTDDREVIERWRQAGDHNSDAGDSVGAASNGDVPPPSITEVFDSIQRLKNNKAPGKGGIEAELLKMGPGAYDFADDVDTVGRTFEAKADQYTRLKCETEKFGLKIYSSKTKYMLVGGAERDRARLGIVVIIDGDEFEVVDEVAYLGSMVTENNDTSREIRRRIISGSRVYYGLHKKIRSKRLSSRTKCSLYKTLIRPVVLYGHETCTMLEEDLRALGVFERRVLRSIFGGVQENGAADYILARGPIALASGKLLAAAAATAREVGWR
ncbi:uncharacterized protein LOC129728212 [Wyeomyia smithii]|uniref:uncharacterized protein LOC129728212 n=1 Tax=Wyeomyia smithii TaxID=174621 RepID=UPI00246810AC|nr:uncharacterized protein LOC129728212 [Wyeomyia smithii]